MAREEIMAWEGRGVGGAIKHTGCNQSLQRGNLMKSRKRTKGGEQKDADLTDLLKTKEK